MTRLAVLILLATLTACTGGTEDRADTLTVALGAEPVTLDPRLTTDANGTRIAGLIFNSLVRLGPDLKPRGDLADRWTREGKVFTFILKPGIQFHNGRDLKPEDIEFSFDQARREGSPFASTVAIVKSVKAKGQQVRIELENYSDVFLTTVLPIVRILPKAETLQAGPAFGNQPLGTGPYKFLSLDSSTVKLEGVRAKTKYLHFKIIRDDFTRYQKMLNGEVDIIQSDLTYDKVKDFEALPDKFTVFKYPGLAMTYLAINFTDPILKQKAVRTALAQAVDRAEIIKFKLYGFATEATSLLTPDNFYFNKNLSNVAADPAAAAKTIENLGLKGKKLILKTSNAPQAVDNGRVLANQLNRTGLQVEVQSYEWGTYYDDVKKGRFQLATMRWVGNVDPDIYAQAFHSREKPPGRNRGSYVNPVLDRLLEGALKLGDPLPRQKAYDEIQKIVLDDLAIIPLWYDHQVAIAKKNLEGYQPNQTGDFRPFSEVSKHP